MPRFFGKGVKKRGETNSRLSSFFTQTSSTGTSHSSRNTTSDSGVSSS